MFSRLKKIIHKTNLELEFWKVHRIARSVQGWLTRKEARELFMLAKEGSGKGAIIEIGSWRGKSTVYLAQGSKIANRKKVYAIDTHKGDGQKDFYREFLGTNMINTRQEFRNNLEIAEVDDWVVPIVKTSQEASKEWSKHKTPIRLLFIDGCHEYEAVKNDFLLWEPFLVDGGVIALHDTGGESEGPTKFVNKVLTKMKRYTKIKLTDSLTIATKRR